MSPLDLFLPLLSILVLDVSEVQGGKWEMGDLEEMVQSVQDRSEKELITDHLQYARHSYLHEFIQRFQQPCEAGIIISMLLTSLEKLCNSQVIGNEHFKPTLRSVHLCVFVCKWRKEAIYRTFWKPLANVSLEKKPDLLQWLPRAFFK